MTSRWESVRPNHLPRWAEYPRHRPTCAPHGDRDGRDAPSACRKLLSFAEYEPGAVRGYFHGDSA